MPSFNLADSRDELIASMQAQIAEMNAQFAHGAAVTPPLLVQATATAQQPHQ